jgi:rhodanese-related sulfurtransferase
MFQSLFSRSPAAYETIDGNKAVDLKNRGAIFVDVRNPDEIGRSGTVKGAIRAPLAGLANFAKPDGSGKLPAADSDTLIVLVCASGNRSGSACAMLADMGYKHLFNLRGGFGAYAQAGGPTER